MASGSSNSNKSELVAIYRLEFYRNKKNWKFRNERKKKENQQPSCESQETESAQDLNKTYVVEPSFNIENETSPLNNAFMHEIPTDDTPENVPSAPPPTPQPPKRIWQQQEAEAGRRPGTWVNRRILEYSETHPEIQNQETLTGCRIDTVQQTFLTPSFNQDQPVSNSHLPKTNIDSIENPSKIESNSPKLNFWINNQASTQNLRTQQPWTNQIEINNSSTNPKNIWTGAPSASPDLVQQESSSALSSLSDTEILANLLKRHTQNVEYQKSGTVPQGPPAVNLQMLLCRQRQPSDVVVQTKTEDKSKNREPALHRADQTNSSNINSGFWTNPALVTRPVFEQNNHPNTPCHSWSNKVPSTPPPFRGRIKPDIWYNHQNTLQNLPLNPHCGSQFISQVSLTDQGSETVPRNLVIPEHNSPKTLQDAKPEGPKLPSLKSHEELDFKGPSPSQENYSTASWCGNQEEPRMWNNPALSSNPEVIRPHSWNNEEWQKQEDSNLHQLETAPTYEDVPKCEQEPEQGDLQYAADQNTLKPQGPLDIEMLAPEQIRQFTDEWLRRLLALHRPSDNCHNEDETASEQNQGVQNDSTDFIREAHEVPHSSEKDPNETREGVCSCLPPLPLPSLSSARLSAALHHSARVLRELLTEQIIRDRLRSLTLFNLVEYPTRDTDLFGSEYVMGGSHVPHSTRDLDPGGGRVIRIDMGRPYRL